MAAVARDTVRVSRERRALIAFVAVCVIAVSTTWSPVTAASETDAEVPIGIVWGGQRPVEYSSVLIEWDREAGIYRAGDEEGSFAYLVTLPGAQGWEFVTILAESWFETTLDDRAAWDVFRWRVLYRRPLDLSETVEE